MSKTIDHSNSSDENVKEPELVIIRRVIRGEDYFYVGLRTNKEFHLSDLVFKGMEQLKQFSGQLVVAVQEPAKFYMNEVNTCQLEAPELTVKFPDVNHIKQTLVTALNNTDTPDCMKDRLRLVLADIVA